MATVILHPSARGGRREVQPASWVGVGVIAAAAVLVEVMGLLAARSAGAPWHPIVAQTVGTAPRWVFGPEWTGVLALLAVGASVVWLARDRDDVCCPLGAFSLVMGLSVAWAVFFYGLQMPLLGFLAGGLMWAAAALASAQFFVVSRAAGWLAVPYWAWATLAAALSASAVLA